MTSEAIEKNKLLLEYEKLIERLEKAEKWASDNKNIKVSFFAFLENT